MTVAQRPPAGLMPRPGTPPGPLEPLSGRSLELPGDLAAYRPLLARLAAAGAVDADRSALVDQAVAVWNRPGFDTFVSLPRLHFTPFDYQLQAAQSVLRRMQGRAILADEVGLGKTIEAGLVLSELRVRGLADRTLVVVPAGLVDQWREELDTKFALPSAVAKGGTWPVDADRPIVIASLAAARRDPLRAALTARDWDLVVADEAHRLRSPRSASGRLARSMRARYLLLLSATPVENRLEDLFELVSLVSPGLLGTLTEFRRRYGASAGPGSIPGPGPAAAVRNVADLRARTREVMVRHRRSEVSVLLPQRLAETVLVRPSPEEAALYARVADRIRGEARDAPHTRLMTLRSLARMAGSTPAAVAPTLDKVGWSDLAADASSISQVEKVRAVLDRVRRHTAAGEKVLVFTAYRRTLETLAAAFDHGGVSAAVYHGSLSRAEKEKAVTTFRDDQPVLLTTESAGEGRNLQFCHVMVNVDLPWNPMQIEQRLGRLHRVGQQHDVVLTNFVGQGTIEERILHVLEAKINLFELVVGELDMILGRVSDDFDFESSVFTAYVEASDDSEFDARLADLGDALAQARTAYVESRTAVDDLVGQSEAL
jgi:SNF2 family DNA or RNA helicase